MVTLSSTVYCTLQVDGVHHWPQCPIEEVAYLRYPHRHMFHITCFKHVNHDDRDVEFIQLKNHVKRHITETWADQDGVCQFGSMSCEMIAKHLILQFDLCKCIVNEDNENGAILTNLDSIATITNQ